MSKISSEDLYRKALEAENGEPISAGARVAHVKAAVECGRALYVNISAVPAEKRSTLIAEINELIERASSSPQQPSASVDVASAL